MWPMLLLLALGLMAIAVDAARTSYCAACHRRYAVFSVAGSRGHVRICWRCRQQRHALKRNFSR